MYHYASLSAPLYYIRSRQPGMEFPLANGDGAAGAFSAFFFAGGDVGLEFVKVVEAVVGDADGVDQAGFLGFVEGAPGAEAGRGGAVGGMD